MSTPSRYEQARQILVRHGHPTAGLEYVGAGEQSACYGTGDIAVLLSQTADGSQVADLTGHVIPSGPDAITSNTYDVLQWLTNQAADAGVRTPRILATGDDPRPYALMERAKGTLASTFPNATGEDHIKWFAALGAEVRKANSVQTTGFGMFVATRQGGYRGRFDTWTDYLDHWLAVHLCVGEHRPEDEKVRDLFLAPASITDRRVASFLNGYGLSRREAEEAVEGGKLMLVLDGLGMSYGWAGRPERREGIRAWLRTVEKLGNAWL